MGRLPMSRTDLSEKQWRQLEPHLPGDPHRGHADVDHRRVLNGILWRQKTGAPWRDVPARYGPWQTCYDRFVRWSRDGNWQRILRLLQAQADASGQIDWMERRWTPLISKPTAAPRAPERPRPKRKKGGRKRRVAGAFRWWLDQQDSLVCGRECPPAFADLNRPRFCRHFRAVATRYDKRGYHSLAVVTIASIVIWLL